MISNLELAQGSKVEKGFFRSLRNLCEFYKLTIPDTQDKKYPENIAFAFSTVKEEFEKIDNRLHLAILQSDTSATSIATIKSAHTGYDLYFFPISEIYHLWEKDKNSKFVNLVLSLFAFQKLQLDVPFYTESYTFLNGCYESIRNFIEEDIEQGYEYDEDLALELIEEIDFIQYAGQKMLSEIVIPSRLDRFEWNVNRFKPYNDKEKAMLEACKDALVLRKKYPEISLTTAIPNYIEEEVQNILCPEMYIGFLWGGESDWLKTNINEYLNNYLNEFSGKQEPSAPQFFNRKVAKEIHDLTMQEELIAFFDKVAKALYAFHEE